MGLVQYRRKRDFAATPEPAGKVGERGGALRFVVQKHAASRLHYDFRLELDGTLKSWAVPKGPSLDPADKRLAMMVEDHPLDYRTFEGTIPAGNYGAGSVIVWDQGTYHGDSVQALRDGLKAGRLTLTLEGEKLRGEFSLLRLRRGEENAWLLVKKQDGHATTDDVTARDRSVISGRTLDDIAAGKSAGRLPRKTSATKVKPAKKAPPAQTARGAVRPMLATLVDEPFDRDGWLFEVKWDGYRAVAEVSGGSVKLSSRNHNSFVRQFAPIAEELRKIKVDVVLDGEIVVLDDEGRSRFQLLQNYRDTGEGRLRYVVFDLLELDGEDLRSLPLRERKDRLPGLLKGLKGIVAGDHVEDRGVAFFRAAQQQELEGIIAKDGSSPYREGRRGPEWLKVKTHARQEAVIGGFTAPKGSRRSLGALVLGVQEGDDLVYIGHTGGGLDAKGLAGLRKRLDPLVRKTCPFVKRPKTNGPVQWVKPELVCEVKFQEWTADGRLRQPIFLGLRADRPAADVVRERPANPPPTKSSTLSVEEGPARITHPDKVYWPADGINKGDLVEYYRRVAPVLLPHLRDRPMSLHRHPDGIDKPGFFQKDVGKQPPPDWVETVTVPNDDGKPVRYTLCQDEASLVYLANLGCIEMNPWNSRRPKLDRPTFLVIDLDPEDIPFRRVVETALHVRKVLDRAGAACWCKTSGKRGLHVAVPLGGKYDHDHARAFAELVARMVNRRLPATTSLERSPSRRQKRVYLDYLQNRRGQTLAAPYSVRPVAGAGVSAPLKWTEVKPTLDPGKFTLHTMPRRIGRVGDLWAGLLGPGIDLKTCLGKMETTLG